MPNRDAVLVDPSKFLLCGSQSLDRPVLCIIVDTEEDFDWRGPFSRNNVHVGSIFGLKQGHDIFRRYDFQPAYLVDYPVIDFPGARDIFGPWLEADECLVGAQLHPWVNPPFEEVVCPFNSYPCNLNPNLERRKLVALTERIREVLAVAPQVYKAGRYGLSIDREATLRNLGYIVDTSILPFRDNSGFAGGPNFFGYPDQPFWTRPDRQFLYLPVTQSLVGALRGLAGTRLVQSLFGRLSSRLHVPGMLARSGLLERVMLSPEGTTVPDMRRLTRTLLDAGHRVFALSLHSPSFVPGGTPYVRSERELADFLRKIESFLEFFRSELGGVPITPPALKTLLQHSGR